MRVARYAALNRQGVHDGAACCAVVCSGGEGSAGAGEGLRLCGGCGAVAYCSAACQRRDYQWHAPVCREMRHGGGNRRVGG